MNWSRSLLLKVLICLLLAGAEARADSFRCGSRLALSGDTTAELISACGEPFRKDSLKKTFSWDGELVQQRVQRWYYKLGRGKLEHQVLIYRDEIVGIETGGR